MSTKKQTVRVIEMDATRGVAMLAVCLAHAVEFVQGRWTGSTGAVLVSIGLVATPTFLLLSGVVCGYLGSLGAQRASQSRWRLIDRGCFLLLVGHLAIGLTIATWSPILPSLFGSFYVTDAVGVGLIFAALSFGRISPSRLVALGLILLLLDGLLSHLLQPHTFFAKDIVRILFGLPEPASYEVGYMVPLVPYLGIFMVGMAGGMKYAVLRRLHIGTRQIAHLCIGIGVACVICALLLKLVWWETQGWVPLVWRPLLHDMTALRQKLPPGLGYVLNYGGIGMIVAGLVGLLSQTRRGLGLVAFFAVVGRASLIVFVLQYWLYSVPERVLQLGTVKGWWFFTLFFLSLVFLWVAAWCWDRTGCNRFLTLGLRRFAAQPIQTHQQALS